MFLAKDVLKICSKFTGEHSCQSAISVNLQSSFIEIALRHGCSPVNLLHIFRTPFSKSTSGWLPVTLYLHKLKRRAQHAVLVIWKHLLLGISSTDCCTPLFHLQSFSKFIQNYYFMLSFCCYVKSRYFITLVTSFA